MTEDLAPDVLVVGAGPAGSALAGLLAVRGRSVLLVDRACFPRLKACGECASPGAVAALRRLGLLAAVHSTDPVPLRGWRFATPEGRTAAGDFDRTTGPALGIRRDAFDAALLRVAVARGAEFREGLRAVTLDLDGPRPSVRLRSAPRRATGPPGTVDRLPDSRGCPGGGVELEVRPRIVVGADGLRSFVSRAAGAVARRPRRVRASLSWRLRGPLPEAGVGRLHLGGPFTAGLAPVGVRGGDGMWALTVVLDPRLHLEALRGDPGVVVEEALGRLGVRQPGGWTADGAPLASGPFDWPVRWAARAPVLLVGDAAGYFDPLTGQGIFRALRSAELAAPAVERALGARTASVTGVAAEPLRRYDRALRRAFRPGRLLQRLLDVALERPALRDRAIGLVAGRPHRGAALIRVTGDIAPVRSLLAPRHWLPPRDPRPELPITPLEVP